MYKQITSCSHDKYYPKCASCVKKTVPCWKNLMGTCNDTNCQFNHYDLEVEIEKIRDERDRLAQDRNDLEVLRQTIVIEQNDRRDYDRKIMQADRILNNRIEKNSILNIKERELENRRKELDKFESELAKRNKNYNKMVQTCSTDMMSKIITFDVGGTIFKTRVSTMVSVPDSMFGPMFSGKYNDINADIIFIDRDPVIFKHILNYLRNDCDVRTLPLNNIDFVRDLQREAKYFGLLDLEKNLTITTRERRKY